MYGNLIDGIFPLINLIVCMLNIKLIGFKIRPKIEFQMNIYNDLDVN